MIARLRGRIAGRAGQGFILDVNGVGYLVSATQSVQRLGDGEITVEIHTVVREDTLALYGFATAEERELFELLLGVSGVGPKVALAIVSGSTPAELRRAIARDDVKRFTAIPGSNQPIVPTPSFAEHLAGEFILHVVQYGDPRALRGHGDLANLGHALAREARS